MATETIENVAHDDTPTARSTSSSAAYSAGFITEIESDSAAGPGRGHHPCPVGQEGRAGVDDAVAPGRLPPLPDHADAGLGQAGDRPDRPAGAQLLPAPKGPKYASLDDVPKELLDTYDKLGVPLHERAKLAGVAVDAVFDSVSVGTTFRKELAEKGIIFCSMSEAIKEHPSWSASTWAPWCRSATTTSPRSTRRCSPMAASCSSPGRALPDGAEHHFRINAGHTGQFERTLIVCEDKAYVSYLEGCTAPMRDENQLHAAVVELVALEDAEIKYSTVQNWYPGDENGVGGIYNFVTKRAECRGARSKVTWTQVETGSAITWKYPSCVLLGDDSVGEFHPWR